MKRRSFFKKSSAAALGLGLASTSFAATSRRKKTKAAKVCATINQQNVSFYTDTIAESIKMVHISDTHLFRDDERGVPYKQYSKRMAGAYNHTKHFRSGAATNPEEAFEEALAHAVESKADAITLGGDIFSFPSEAAIEWAHERLEKTGIPYIYTAGNHDWHYEGMEGSLAELRDTWTRKRLKPLYRGNNPLMAAYDIKGVRIVAIDNSIYEINEEQLAFFKEQVATGKPLILLVHIPMYAPGKAIWYGCGHPEWGAKSDRIYELEGRQQWPERGHTATTFTFHKEVFSAPNLLGVLAGHVHESSVEIIKGKPQVVSLDNAHGAYLDIDLMPMSDIDKDVLYS